MLSGSWLVRPDFLMGIVYSSMVLVPDWMQRSRDHVLCVEHLPVRTRWMIYYALVVAILLYGALERDPFIYFQF